MKFTENQWGAIVLAFIVVFVLLALNTLTK